MATDGTTFLNPIGIGFTVLMGLLILILPRRYALLPVIVLTSYMTMGERVMVAGLNFTMIRILALLGWARIVFRGDVHRIKLNSIDKALLWWTISSIVAHTLLWRTSQEFINRLGLAYDAVGLYFLFRFLLRSLDDVQRVAKFLAILIVPLAASMALEKTTGTNAFAVFGGVPAVTIVRDGVLRCQGPFSHPILAGTFGATLFPLFVGLWWKGGRDRFIAVLGILASAVITFTSGSSGPVIAYLFGIVGLAMWSQRRRMRTVRWGLLLTLIALHLVMKAPVWFLMSRVEIFSGSTGYHRAYLIDRAVANFGDWWLVGTKSTALWADEDAHLFDVTNQYVNEAVNGGLLTMILFITIIVRCFRGVGLSVRAAEEKEPGNVPLFLWAMGAALLAHVASYMSVAYFDQNIVNWYLLLGMISTVTDLFPLPREEPHAVPSQITDTVEMKARAGLASSIM